jgi:23S rRNA pseudouridine1911/1915/1917 synthase
LLADIPGMRLDAFLARRLGCYSRSYLKGLIERGFVFVGGASCRADDRLKGEERIEISFPEFPWRLSGDFEGWILHEDRQLLVLDKPPGLLMHPLGTSWLSAPEAALSEPEPNLAGILQKERPAIIKSGASRCGIVHRLDRQTSGVLLVAKTPQAQESLIAQFRGRKIEKFYQAIVRGVPRGRAHQVSAPVGRKPRQRKVIVTPLGKSAQTSFSVIDSCPYASLVEARPLTGRTHQIRAHLAFLGHPVMGDSEFDWRAPGPKPPRLMLHAFRIAFAHPGTGKRIDFRARLPKDFKDFWKECRRGSPAAS